MERGTSIAPSWICDADVRARCRVGKALQHQDASAKGESSRGDVAVSGADEQREKQNGFILLKGHGDSKFIRNSKCIALGLWGKMTGSGRSVGA